MTGGHLRRADGGLVGTLAAETIRNFKFDLAVIGCSALDVDGDMLDFDIQEVSVSQAILRQSRRSFLVADHSKFKRTRPRASRPWPMSMCFSPTARWTPRLQAACTGWDTELVVAPA